MSNPQTPQDRVVLREQENKFNQFASIQQPSVPLKQTASLFPVESDDNQRKLIHSSIGEFPQFPKSKLITTPKPPLSQTKGAAVRPKGISFIPLNCKLEGQSMQCLAFDFQNTHQHNSSADKKQNKPNFKCLQRKKQTLQTHCHSEKGRNTTTKVTVPSPKLFENCSHTPVQFDKNQFSMTSFATNQNQNSESLVTEISLPTVLQPNNSKQYRNEQYPTAV